MPTSTDAYIGILDLPTATALDGSEWVPLSQGGTDRRTQSGSISAWAVSGANFVMASCSVGYTNQRLLTGSTNIAVTDAGAGSTITVSVIASAGLTVIGTASTASGHTGDITGTTDQVLRVSSAGTSLGFGKINLASSFAVNNTLAVEFGGSGNNIFNPYQVILGGSAATSPFRQVTAGTSAGQVLTWVSSVADPTWSTVAGTVSSGLSGQLAFYSSDGTNLRGSSYANISSAVVTLGTTTGLSGNLALASSAGATTTLAPSTATNTATFPLTSTILIGRDTVDTLTGKTFDTAGSSNIFRINGNLITAVTGSSNTVVLSSSPTIQAAVLQAVSSFGIRTTGAAFDLNFISTEALTASRTLSIRVNNVNRNLNLLGDFTVASSFAMSVTSTAASSVTMPVTGLVVSASGTFTLENKTFNTVTNTFQISSNTISTASSVLDIITSSAGALLYRSTGTTWSGLTIGTSAQVLTGGTIPQWVTLSAGGDVVGPSGATTGAAAVYASTSGKLLRDSLLLVSSATGAISRSGGGGIGVEATNTATTPSSFEVGYVVTSSVLSSGAVSFSAGTAFDVTSISITAGNWLVSGNLVFTTSAGTMTSGNVWLSTAAATEPTRPAEGGQQFIQGLSLGSGSDFILSAGMRRFSSSSTLTIRLGARNTGASGTAYGYIYGIRQP